MLPSHSTRASSVIVHRVPAAMVDHFLAWQQGISQAVAKFPGYQRTEIYPAAPPQQPEWVVVLHFDNDAALRGWLDSPVRAEWTARLSKEIADFRVKTVTGGFGPWFARFVDDTGAPPHWKMALAVLLGLYPTVMLLSLFVVPAPPRVNLAVSVLISNILGVCLLEWIIMPGLNRVLGPWLRARGAAGRATSAVGLILILVILAVLAVLFHRITSANPHPLSRLTTASRWV